MLIVTEKCIVAEEILNKIKNATSKYSNTKILIPNALLNLCLLPLY